MKIVFTILTVLLLWGCSFKKIGASAGDGLGEGLNKHTDSIGLNAVHGALSELTDTANQHHLQHLVDSIVTALGDRLVQKASETSDSLFKKKVWNWADSLVETLTGKKLQLNVDQVQRIFFGKTKKDIAEMKQTISDLISQITSTDTRNKLDSLVASLLGENTNKRVRNLADSFVSHIVDTALAKIDRDYQAGLGKHVREDTSFVRDNAWVLLIVLSVIAIIIIFLVWWSRRKYLRLTTILTKQIDRIPDKRLYETVTGEIKSDAMTAGLEGQLRDLLSENGLLHSDRIRT